MLLPSARRWLGAVVSEEVTAGGLWSGKHRAPILYRTGVRGRQCRWGKSRVLQPPKRPVSSPVPKQRCWEEGLAG